jgi:hypothetical protein
VLGRVLVLPVFVFRVFAFPVLPVFPVFVFIGGAGVGVDADTVGVAIALFALLAFEVFVLPSAPHPIITAETATHRPVAKSFLINIFVLSSFSFQPIDGWPMQLYSGDHPQN